MADGEDGKRDGMERAERHADPHWWVCMLESARAVARRKPYFDSENVVRWCVEHHPNASTHEPRAIGPLMREAAKAGICRPTQDWNASTLAQCHKRPMRMWFSLVYDGPSPLRPPRRRHQIDPRQLDWLE